MKTRRIFAQPGEPIEIINAWGISCLKAVAQYDDLTPTIVVYPQPGVDLYSIKTAPDHLTHEPEPSKPTE